MDSLILELSNIGFTEYETKAYNTLLQQNLLSASEIYKKAGIPRGRIYDILQQLSQKGFCEIVPGAVNKYTAVDPKIAINNLIEQQRRETKISEHTMVQTANILHEKYVSMDDNSSPLDYIHVYTTKPNMIKKVEKMAGSCNKVFRTFNKPPYVTTKTKRRDSVIKKGSKFKAIYEVEYNNLEDFINCIEYYEQKGEEIRLIEKLPLKLIISDESTLMFTMKNSENVDSSIISIVITHSDIINAFIEYYEIYWKRAMTLEEFKTKEKR